jgi:serine protease Do
MRPFSLRLVLGMLIFFVFIYGTASAAVTNSSSSNIALEARLIQGEVYIKASSLLKESGGTGAYNEQTKQFDYVPAQTIPTVVEAVSPSVVAIIGKPKAGAYQQVDRFSLAHGTGVIISEDGWIVTNAHVVENMNEIIVLTHNEKKFNVEKVLSDSESDIALVKIKAKGLKPAVFAPSDKVEVGETVVAIGTPISFSLKNSATSGIISGVDRSAHSSYRLLQTDAAINPGNSGGPLVNMDGHVIGINSMKFVDVSVDNMGFSIPTNTVQYIIDHLKEYGKVKRPYIGFELEESWEAVIGLSKDKPLTVKRVETNSAASKLGISRGDRLYSIDRESIATLIDLNEKLKSYMPGDKVIVTFQSKGDIVQKTITLQE